MSTINIPFVPSQKIVQSDGTIHPEWQQYFENLSSETQRNFNREGHYLPSQPTENISLLNTNQSKGALIYDSEKETAQVNNDGVYRPIQVTKIQMTTAQRNAVTSDKRDDLWVHDTDESKLYTGIGGVWKEVNLT